MRQLVKTHLPTVTLVCVTGIDIENAIFALSKSISNLEFSAVKLIGPSAPKFLPNGIQFEKAHNSQLNSIDAYSHYVLYDLWRHVETEHCLVIQADGFVINPTHWTDEFLKYDYIGAPWLISESAYIDPFGNHQRVGNGGFSLRSRKLLTAPQHIDIPWDVNSNDFYRHMNVGLLSEDGNICVHNRHLFEKHGCVFAPLEVACRFSIENRLPEHKGLKPFGFHKRLPSMRTKMDIWLERKKFRKQYSFA